MPNRLAREKSLYLRQHADNPVDWYPWGAEALATAREQDKPILVSIGYSSCHWCHVMAHESFEDPYIARLMNTHFVCIKVDREERPDIDQIYMDAVHMLNGQGGWPLNVFCLPDGRPFAGGTYFPPDEERGHNLVPWPQLLIRVADYFARQREDLEENARAIIGNLQASNTPHQLTGDALGKGDFLLAMNQLLGNQDPEFGGFGRSPKFPPSMSLAFLLAMRGSATVEEGLPQKAQAIDMAVNRTLTAMAHGGLFDQIGGGFARYAVDQQWQIPHFEKMLYDNALLIDIYARAHQRYPKALYRKVVEETIGWLQREMSGPGGAFFAALDADTDGEEGLTYLWTPAEVASVLGDGAQAFCDAYGITPEGNFENSGRTHPVLLAADPATRDAMEAARLALLEARTHRPQPGRDEKCLVAWNALVVRGLSRAAFTFWRKDWLETARAVAEWIWSAMRREGDRLAAVAYDGQPHGEATLNDYAYTAEAYLALAAVIEWQHPGQSALWKERAWLLLQAVEDQFRDPEGMGYFVVARDQADQLVHRKKDWYDNATPAGQSALLHAHAQLSVTHSNELSGLVLGQLATAYPGIVTTAPAAASHALCALVEHAIGVAVIKIRPGSDMEALRRAITSKPWRPVFLQVEDSLPEGTDYQLCVGTQCLAPTASIESLIEGL